MNVARLVSDTLDLKRHRVVEVSGDTDQVVVTLDRIRRRHQPCSGCGEFARVRDRLAERTWRHVPLWGIDVALRYRPARVACPACGMKVEAIPWSSGKSSLSVPLVVVLSTWARDLSWATVARMFGVAWSTVSAAVDRAVVYGVARRDVEGVRLIGIDELSRKKGHVYHTNVYDLATRRLLWSGEDRTKKTLEDFFAWFGEENAAKLEGVCCDMWANYIDVVAEKAPQALMVFDKFHIVRHLLKAVNDVRKAEARELGHNPAVLKDTRYILLKNPENLTDKQSLRLSDLMKMDLKVLRAYKLKELFRELWTCKTRPAAKRFLDQWFRWATHSRLNPMRDFAWMIRRHEAGILDWFKIPINNGCVEAMNNNAKVVSHRARGYRTARVFILSMMHCLADLELPQTVHKFS